MSWGYPCFRTEGIVQFQQQFLEPQGVPGHANAGLGRAPPKGKHGKYMGEASYL